MKRTHRNKQKNVLHQRIAAGENEAIKELVHCYSRWVQIVIYRIMKNSGRIRTIDRRDVEEITSDVFYKVCRDIRTFDPSRATLKTWIEMKTVYTTRDFIREKMREQQKMTKLLEHVRFEHRELGLRSSAHTLDRYEERALLQRLGDAVIRLPESTRKLILLYFAEGKSYIEIAKLTGTPEGTVKSKLHRVQKLLKAKVFEADIE